MHERQTPGLIDPPNDLEARRMLVAITSGDRSALTNLYMSYYGCLAHFLSQFMGSDNRVGDVINDTFMTIWESARDFPFESKVSVWIFRIAHRHVSRFVRCHTLRGLAHGDRRFKGQPREPGTETKTHRPLVWALQRLPTEQRVVLTLCYRMGYSVREIAVITDSQVETVELRMFQARGQLLRYLTTQGAVDSMIATTAIAPRGVDVVAINRAADISVGLIRALARKGSSPEDQPCPRG